MIDFNFQAAERGEELPPRGERGARYTPYGKPGATGKTAGATGSVKGATATGSGSENGLSSAQLAQLASLVPTNQNSDQCCTNDENANHAVNHLVDHLVQPPLTTPQPQPTLTNQQPEKTQSLDPTPKQSEVLNRSSDSVGNSRSPSHKSQE